MTPLKFIWGEGLVDIYVDKERKIFLIPDSEYGGPISNIDSPFKTVILYRSRSGLSGEGLIFVEEEINFDVISVVNSKRPAIDRITLSLPVAVINRDERVIEIWWKDCSSTLVDIKKERVQYFTAVENQSRINVIPGTRFVVDTDDPDNGIRIQYGEIIRTRAGGVVRVSPVLARVLAVELFDGVWEYRDSYKIRYLLRPDDQVLKFFKLRIDKGIDTEMDTEMDREMDRD